MVLFSYSIEINAKIVVLVIDTGVSISHDKMKKHVNPIYQNSYDFVDLHGHGTHVSGIILKDTCEEVELRSCHFYDPMQVMSDRITNYLNCLRFAFKLQPDIINISAGGSNSNSDEFKLLNLLRNIPIVAAIGNESEDINLHPYYPASYNFKNLIVVGNLNQDGTHAKNSNYGKLGMSWEVGMNIWSTLPNGKFGYMSGTSQATARKTNRILLEKCRRLHKNEY